MKRYELALEIIDPSHRDKLILALVHQGNNVYYNAQESEFGTVYCTITEEEIKEIPR